MTTPMRRALVTGGSGAIGAAICRRLAADGLAVIVHANRQFGVADTLAEQLRGEGRDAIAVQFDVTDADATQAALHKLLASGPIQVLVNNAGIHSDAPFVGMSRQQWQQVVDVSLQGFFNVTQPLVMPMMRTRWGRIVSMSSVAAQLGNRGQANYAAAKAALHAASRTLALELASRGVTANVVAPGVIASDMSSQAFDAKTIHQLVPMKRAGQPEEVAELVGFLVSDRAAYISGQVIGINGALA